jgi:hypothetical protein
MTEVQAPEKARTETSVKIAAFENDLADKLQKFNSAPVLFVGSGLSKRYLGLPSWEALLIELANITDKEYAYYRANADGDYPKIAGLLSQPLNEIMWTDVYRRIRADYQDFLLKRDSAIKIFVAQRMAKLVRTKDKDLLEELELLKVATIDAVITTNYDSLIEELFTEFEVFVGQDELLLSDLRGVGEIYKIHGSESDPNSLVLTGEDYKAYSDRNAYLAAKLMTLFAEHPIIFIGYSLSDPNVIEILESLVRCLKNEHIFKLQNRLLFVHWAKDASPTISNTVMQIGGINLPVTNIEVADYKALFSVLGRLKRKFSAHTLRRLKDHIYELILTNDPKGRLHVLNIDDINNESPDVVIGVGAIAEYGRQGYKRITRVDLIEDILNDDKGYDPELIVTDTLPDFLSSGSYFPFVKYMLKAGYIDPKGTVLNQDKLDPRLIERLQAGVRLLRSTRPTQLVMRLARSSASFDTLAADNKKEHVLQALPFLTISKINGVKLREYLLEHKAEAIVDGKCETNYAKAICLLELLDNLELVT